ANIISAFQAGTFFGALGSCWAADRFGRRRALCGAMCVFMAGAALMTGSCGRIEAFVVGRGVAGLGLGAMAPVVPVYITELSPPSIRGRMIGMLEISCQVAAMCGFWTNYAVNRTVDPRSGMAQWQIPIGIQLLPGALMLLATPFCPETPRWLCSRNRFAAAEAALCRVRGLPCEHPYVAREMREMRAEVARTYRVGGRHGWGRGTTTLMDHGWLADAKNDRAHNMTGVGIVVYYSPRIFASLGIRTTDLKLFATGFYGVAKTLGTLVFMFWVADRLGRRKGFVYGAFVGAVPMFYIGAYIMKADPAAATTATTANPAAAATSSAWGYLAIICIYVLAVICSASWGGITWLYVSEIYPLHIRSLCMSLTIANERVWSFVITRSTPYMITDMGYGVWFFFGALQVLMGGWALWCMRETKVSEWSLCAVETAFARRGTWLTDGGVVGFAD
ncbi:Quinate permease, partial [Diplodia seriata]